MAITMVIGLGTNTARVFTVLLFVLLLGCDNQSQHIALGTLERDRIAHTATTNEILIALPVARGSIVETGTVLARLDDTKQRALVEKAKAEVAKAKANFEKLQKGARSEEIAAVRANVAGAKASLVERQANYKRAKDMADRDSTSQADLDLAHASRDTAIANLRSSQEKLRELTTGTREEDLRIAEASLKAVVAALAVETKTLSDLTIRATRDGILDTLPWNLGERVTSGSPLAVVLAGKTPFARVYIPEPYRVKIKVGDELVIRVDGLDNTLVGYIRWIANEPAFSPYYALNQQERSHLMYLAEVQLPDSAADLPSGVPAQVELP